MCRLLLIDDDVDMLKVCNALLSRRGFEVLTASNWDDAYHTLQTFTPEIILLDVFLKGIDGLQVCKRLKSSPKTAQIPIIIVSGFPKVADKVTYEYEADAFVTKPFEMDDLVRKIHETLSAHTILT